MQLVSYHWADGREGMLAESPPNDKGHQGISKNIRLNEQLANNLPIMLSDRTIEQ
ncbi:MAG: hypothetical protein BroJett018_04120 [Chloroflexota bacterium]|nr:MAG: hypothetical protein BroJett018_04120 [Chloroflexota bacterium]